ncbi:MAG TPA: ThiF family adenylyltransferase, partial [Actinoplanes sp.]|nr:ThiF family adenylyltransferase [Actinoplanes sp.]
TTSGPTRNTIMVMKEQRRRPIESRGSRRPGRRDRRLAWVGDLGAIDVPLRSWSDIAKRLGHRADEVARLVSFGSVNLLLLRYSRGGRPAALAVSVRSGTGGIVTKACESADTSIATRSLRAGVAAPELVNARIAIVGLGAVGSFAADLLFRSGVRHLMLIDAERLRPGNVVRHLGGVDDVGDFKVAVVKRRLAASGFDVDGVLHQVGWLTRLTEAVNLVREHHVVLDATANGRASSLLATAAEIMGRGANHTVISACVQREGQIVRGDRFPLRTQERHMPGLFAEPDAGGLREYGCGEPISRTPPGAVLAAAELACRMVIDRATHDCVLPASMVDVRVPQPDASFDRLGLITSADASTPLAA